MGKRNSSNVSRYTTPVNVHLANGKARTLWTQGKGYWQAFPGSCHNNITGTITLHKCLSKQLFREYGFSSHCEYFYVIPSKKFYLWQWIHHSTRNSTKYLHVSAILGHPWGHWPQHARTMFKLFYCILYYTVYHVGFFVTNSSSSTPSKCTIRSLTLFLISQSIRF
jgi:hypothetical protein